MRRLAKPPRILVGPPPTTEKARYASVGHWLTYARFDRMSPGERHKIRLGFDGDDDSNRRSNHGGTDAL